MASDPTLPYEPIVIDGETYKLCFDLNAIADYEERQMAKGYESDLLRAKWCALNTSMLRGLFIASLAVYQPEIKDADARKLFAKADYNELARAVDTGYRHFAPEPDPEEEASEEPAFLQQQP